MDDKNKISGQVDGISIFWSTTDGLLSRLIRRVTKSEYSHCGLILHLTNGRDVYYESLFSEGVIGAKMLADLVAWSWWPGRTLRMERLDWLRPDQIAAIAARALKMAGHAGYGKWQLIMQWYFEDVGRMTGFRLRNTPNKVTCSEFVSRACYDQVILLDWVRDHHDSVTPESILQRLDVIRIARLNQ